MSYAVKEIFYTLQGEGLNAGRPAVFCRFAGCNLWSGREADRAAAVCRFCDTDFVGLDGTLGGRYPTADALAERLGACWPSVPGDPRPTVGTPAHPIADDASAPRAGREPDAGGVAPAALHDGAPARRFVVLTGGEPLLQVDAALVLALHARGFEIAVETNGSLEPPPGIDWICVSPKAGAPLRLVRGDELKVVVPQPGLDLDRLAQLAFAHRLLQPMDGPDRAANTRLAVAACLADPRWRLSVQTHKTIGIR